MHGCVRHLAHLLAPISPCTRLHILHMSSSSLAPLSARMHALAALTCHHVAIGDFATVRFILYRPVPSLLPSVDAASYCPSPQPSPYPFSTPSPLPHRPPFPLLPLSPTSISLHVAFLSFTHLPVHILATPYRATQSRRRKPTCL